MGCAVLPAPRLRRLAVALCLLTGCSTSPGRGFSLFPEGHRLTEDAKTFRKVNSEPWPLPRELDKKVLLPYVLEPGDVLLVQPADLDSPVRLPGDQPILPDGSINLGRYGRLVVAGKTVDQVEAEVKTLIDAQTKNAGPITVRLVTRQSKVYYVLGEVNAPGAFTLNGRETVLDGIVTAGGLTDRASRGKIILARPTPAHSCRVVLPVCYNDIVQLGDTATNYQLAPGDRVYVPSRSCVEDLFHHKHHSCQPETPCPPPPPDCPPAPLPKPPAGPGDGPAIHTEGTTLRPTAK